MTRTQKMTKLGNAIRAYRGCYNPKTEKWKRPPNPKKAIRILDYLAVLGVQEPIIALADIQQFKTFDEMRAWMKRLESK